MSDAFISYLGNNVPEFNEYSKKHGTPSIKRINKMVQGIKMPAQEVLERGTQYKDKSFSIKSEFNDVEGFIKYFRGFMVDIENQLRDNPLEVFVGIEAFSFNSYNSIGLRYQIQEHPQDYKVRVKENNRMKEINSLIPLVQAAHQSFLTARQEHINDQRKLSIKRKMEELQRELDELGEN